jgi:UDP-GlcNAc:undecaprenyl-phosphate GlcNAc-1-phosphate transferase
MYSLGILAIAGFLLSLMLTPLLRDWSIRAGLVDRPDNQRKMHAADTPRVGGIPILLSYAGAYAVLFLLPVKSRDFIQGNFDVILRLLPSVAIIFFTGLLDDWVQLAPWQKLTGQCAAAGAAYIAGVRLLGVAGHDLAPWASFLLTAGWLVLCSNAFNLIDGVDGLAAGVGLTATLTTGAAGILHGDIPLGLATAPLAGALLGFLRYNFNPASIFMGDSGSLSVGFLLGAYGVIWSQKSATLLGVAAPVLALALPLLEVSISVVRRFLHNEPIFSPDRGHIHHRLLERGFTPRRVALLLYGACGVGATLSLLQSLIHNEYRAAAILLFGAFSCAGVRYLRYAEFVAAGRFLAAGLRPVLSAHVKLELLERNLSAAATVGECWESLVCAGRSLGYSHMVARLGNARFSTQDGAVSENAHWQMRLNLASDIWINITQHPGGNEQPVLLIPFADVLRRRLPGKLRALTDQASRNSITTTVISSDCVAPPANIATAS